MTTDSTPTLLGRECKHAIYIAAKDGQPHDMLAIKEYEHYSDGTKKPNLRLVYDYKRPFWITRENYRNHRDKKEWEDLSKLQEYKCTQVNLFKSICRALGRAPSQGSLRMLFRSPYIYGADVTTPVLAKYAYMKKWPTCVSDNKVAIVDSETDMIEGHEEIIMLSITMKQQAKIIIVESFMKGIHDPTSKIHAAFHKYLGEHVASRNIDLQIEYVKNAGECAARCVQTAHEWKPDIFAIWNMNFDIPKMISAMEKYGFDPAEVWSDPSVPAPFRHFKYIQGPSQKVTASGKTMALHPAEQWHVVETPASFYVLDAMCVYLKLRIAKGKEPSYSLDYVLNKHLGIRKLKFEEANHVSGPMWHQLMQREYKVEYCIYNLFDCISLELLDEKTTDLTRLLSALCGFSEYHRFGSQPRRLCDDLHFYVLENYNKVIGTTSDKMEDDFDAVTPSLQDWIVTLPAYLVHDDGEKILEEVPDVTSNFRVHVADLDVESTYPSGQRLANLSRETTARELCRIEGISEDVQRATGINLSGGYVNAVEIVTRLYKAPGFDDLLTAFRSEVMPNSRAKPALMEALQHEAATMSEGVDELRESLDVVSQEHLEVSTEEAAMESLNLPEEVEPLQDDFAWAN